MSVDFIGMISPRQASEIHRPSGPPVDKAWIKDFAQAHDRGGFDRVLVGYYTDQPDGFLLAQYAASVTDQLGIMLAHRPGYVAPTLAARKLATLDHFTDGRAAVHIISGGDDADQRREGDYLSHGERYARTDEYVGLLRQLWSADKPVSHEGRYYRFENAFTPVKPLNRPSLHVYFGGSSEAAIEVGGRHADTFALWGETRAQVRQTVEAVTASAARAGRPAPKFSVSFRPILAATEEAAWERAESILERVLAVRKETGLGAPPSATSVGSQRLLDAAAQGDILEGRLYTAIAAATGGRGNTTALVGTPDQVAESMLQYWELGVTTFLIRGFDQLPDAVGYGRDLLPIVRAEVARREAATPARR